ncbi:zincin-like metallopeptidase domain-containing protein [Tenacibaculum caenipelagi]|uniref:Antirestriction protein ArdC n=1 Tax=Tenacibaculum caenipelagi TaxID=1325435 RepID=A0A4R6TCR2_9FLAO|nr:zincin-like metallopeptidase domain-containing protein [Tenacibaculum caenipelagi]TDQ22741.1 antirestriction protein ArdC [Tenacibaculum caenipelagi]
MTVSQRFEKLNGSEVSREVLENIIADAKKANETEIVYRLSKILLDNPNSEEFYIELKKYPKALNAPLKKVDCTEVLNDNGTLKKGWSFENGSFFSAKKNTSEVTTDFTEKELKALGVPFIENPTTVDDEVYFLGKPVSSEDIYKMITDKMVSLVKNATGFGYKKKWGDYEYYEKDGFLIPFNFVTKKEYRGVNFLMLKDSDLYSVYDNPYFLTLKQVKERKGTIKKGAKAKSVIYFTLLFKFVDKKKNIDFGTYDKKKMIAFLKKNKISEKQFNLVVRQVPIIKYYNVFNGSDIEGIDFKLDTLKVGKVYKSEESKSHKKNEVAELILKHQPKPSPSLSHGGNRAFYRPSTDSIKMPRLNSFETPNDYYRTLFHELSHSTGHPSRLKRDFTGKFGSKSYAKEELIAEFGAVFLSAQAGIIWHSDKNHAEYLKNWLSVLKFAEDDKRFLMRAASQAQKSTDLILNLNKDNEPAFYKDLIKLVKSKPKKKPEPKQMQLALAGQKLTSSVEKFTPEIPKIKEEAQPAETFLAAPIVFDTPQETESFIKQEEPTVTEKKPKPVQPQLKQNSGSSLADKLLERQNKVYEYYNISDEYISAFLGKIEKKEKESVVITLTGGQGSGKTRKTFRFMNALAKNYRVGHGSLEEHPDSTLYWDKVYEYIDDDSFSNISNPVIESVEDLDTLIKNNDVIVIDSFAKMQELEKGFEIDKDLRKKYDGKLFLVIFQQTADGKMRGGTKSQYDADIVLFTEKFNDYTKSYIYPDKNRYQKTPLHELRYNIYSGELQKIEEEKEE